MRQKFFWTAAEARAFAKGLQDAKISEVYNPFGETTTCYIVEWGGRQ